MTSSTPIQEGTDQGSAADTTVGGRCREQKHVGAFTNCRIRNSRVELPGGGRGTVGSPQRYCWSRQRSGALHREDSACAGEGGRGSREARISRRVHARPARGTGVHCGNRQRHRGRKLAGRMHAWLHGMHRRSCMSRSCPLQNRADQDTRFSGETDFKRCRGFRAAPRRDSRSCCSSRRYASAKRRRNEDDPGGAVCTRQEPPEKQARWNAMITLSWLRRLSCDMTMMEARRKTT